MLGTVVLGAIFTDIKGFAKGKYSPRERNLGQVQFVHGGVCRNIAEDIAASGMPVTLVSMTEHSALGTEVVNHLNEAGVNTEFVFPVKENGIGKWLVILNESGDVAAQLSCPPDMRPLAEFVDVYGDTFVRDAKNIILEMDIGVEITEKVLALAKRYQKPVYAIVGNMSVLLQRPDFITATDCFICNEMEFGRFFDCDTAFYSPAQMLAFLQEKAILSDFPSCVVTMGSKGCVFFDRKTDDSGWLPAIDTQVVDTTGAGDAFLAGAVMGLGEGLSLRRSAELGAAIASLAIGSDRSACPKNDIPASFLPPAIDRVVCFSAPDK